MKRTAKVVLFICLQLIIIGLAFLAGWHNGNPGDRERSEQYDFELEMRDVWNRQDCRIRLKQFQPLVESLQLNGDITNTVAHLNQLIDAEIYGLSGWTEHRSKVSELQWPNGEAEFQVLLRIAEYRLNHPVTYEAPSFYRNRIPWILKQVLECRDRRKANPKWVPPQTEGETRRLKP